MDQTPAPHAPMMPKSKYVTLDNNKENIIKLIRETIVDPRIRLLEWAKYTKQTANIRIGYPGQHLASLVTGVEGTRTGARGHDLQDGSEVKSCSRIDQLDKCKSCALGVARSELACPFCSSTNIERKNDSKWLFTVKSEAELDQLVGYDRVLLMLGDYPNFQQGDFSTLRFQAFEIWPLAERSAAFSQLMCGYYQNIYLPKILQTGKQPAPKNFWPYSYQFYKCAPVLTMSTIVTMADTSPEITIEEYVEPRADRSAIRSPSMPAHLLSSAEIPLITSLDDADLEECLREGVTVRHYRSSSSKEKKNLLAYIPPTVLSQLPLRDTDKPVIQSKEYRRRVIG